MEKIILIFQREYLTRVRKKSFVIMTLLAPLLMAAFIVVPVMLSQISSNQKVVAVADEGNIFAGELPTDPSNDLRYEAVPAQLDAAKAAFKKGKYAALLYIPRYDMAEPKGFRIFSKENLSLNTQISLERLINRQIEAARMRQAGLDKATLDKIKADVDLETINLSDDGEKTSSTGVTTGIAYLCAFLIYMFIFIYGVQIMRGVIEEKTNRIVEVVISSVKPFQLMMGKVLGIAAVGLTQLLLWVILSTAVTTGLASVFGAEKVVAARTGQLQQATAPQAGTVAAGTSTPAASTVTATTAKEKENPAVKIQQSFVAGLASINLPLIIGAFLFYFLGGYLFYGALFGAIGSAVDNETDTQQFMLPVTMPLILTFVIAQSVIIRDPNGTVATWMSMIPFTSPIAMMMRLPFGGVPGWQLLLSMALLILGFLLTIWVAARIYRVGILMYGKKVTYGELSKWMFYKA
ncbi:ABC transporter permease [Hymenobacter sp. HSC-4F20]|uniref:ABC transporter permease n=1 Tax=Hymenobacter sp. HSC-4F20 TaxID=2864135 RepID=UPI001C72CF7E|nr:ABC transporter permease [Hymenobacter sp. HSC-4F20]MBX0292109.1 ABC transporter permease [Hymenobacter sp. HSC-4F20]